MWRKIILAIVISAVILTGAAGAIFADCKDLDRSYDYDHLGSGSWGPISWGKFVAECKDFDWDYNFDYKHLSQGPWGKSSNLIAAGDKVRGDIAEGPANQLGECPFTG